MSLLARPSVIFAIIFGCFAVLLPRVLLPLFRPRQSSPAHPTNDHFRQSPPLIPRTDDHGTTEHITDSSSHMYDVETNIPVHQSDADNQQPLIIDQNHSKSAVTFALPMYTVGIAVFFLYTCFNYWKKRNTEESQIKNRYSSNNIQWNAQKRKFNYQTKNRDDEDDEQNEEDLYAGLDPDYVEYLRSKKQKEIDAEQILSTEQRQMHHTLDEMKNSLSFISSKLGANQRNTHLTNNEISQLQDRLASTEVQMCKILNALDAASNQMHQLTRNTRQALDEPQQMNVNEEDHDRLSSRSQSESEESANEDEQSNSEEDSSHNQVNQHEEESSSSSSSYEDDEPPYQQDNDSESESSSERYGLMTTNYEYDSTTIDDYELDTATKTEQATDSRTKVQEWHQRNHSQSLSSNNSSTEQDQAIPSNDE